MKTAEAAGKGIADRYATALLDVALEAGDDPDLLIADFADFASTLEQTPALRRALAPGALPAARRDSLARQVVAMHTENPRLRRFVALMAARERGAWLPAALEALRRAVDARRGIADVRLTSAWPLSEAEAARLSEALGKALGIVPRLQLEVDPTLLGGFIARVGNTIYDASVERELARFEESAA